MDQPNCKSKLKELQANIKRSKLEHRELEYEFQKLIIQRNDCDRSAMKAFRNKYNSILEEDKRRIARNEKIKQMLERIDYQASALAAKSERLKMLKSHYEKNLYRAFGSNSSRTDSPDRYIPKQRTKSVDAHTQIPRPNYEVYNNEEDDLSNRNYYAASREPRSISTSRINQRDYNTGLNFEQRSIRFNTETEGDREKDRTPQNNNKGVRLFYGSELMNLPNLKVENEIPIQDMKINDQALKQPSNITFGTAEYVPKSSFTPSLITKPLYEANVDYRTFQDPQSLVVMEDPQGTVRFNAVQNSNSPNADFNNPNQNPMTQLSYISSNNGTSLTEHSSHSQYDDSNKKQDASLYNSSVKNMQPPYFEHQDTNSSIQNHTLQTPMERVSYSHYQANSEPPIEPSNARAQINNDKNMSSYLQNSEENNNVSIQNQPVENISFPEVINTLSYETTDDSQKVVIPQNKSQSSLQQESVDGLEPQFIPNMVQEVQPILAKQTEAVKINKPNSSKPNTSILETPSINLPQGIHQVWEKVVDVEIVNTSSVSYPTESNEPRNDVIDKIYKEISSLGESTADGENSEPLKPLDIDNRAEIIEKIEEHYYGEKIKSDENIADIYSNNVNENQNYEPQNEQLPIQSEPDFGYSNEPQMYQDPDPNYEIQNPNTTEQVEYQNYDTNDQNYYGAEPPDHPDNYASEPVNNYNMEHQMNDPNYMYAQNENYQSGNETGYAIEPDPQTYTIGENQEQYTDISNQYYEHQSQMQGNEQYIENVIESDQQYTNEIYNQNMPYDEPNLSQKEFQSRNENAPAEIYQEYPIDQQPQVESTIQYEYPANPIQNIPPTTPKLSGMSSPSTQDEISVNQLSSAEQFSSSILVDSKSPDEIKPDTLVTTKPQIEVKKKRVNFLDSSESEQRSGEDNPIPKITGKDQSDSDFEFSVKSN